MIPNVYLLRSNLLFYSMFHFLSLSCYFIFFYPILLNSTTVELTYICAKYEMFLLLLLLLALLDQEQHKKLGRCGCFKMNGYILGRVWSQCTCLCCFSFSFKISELFFLTSEMRKYFASVKKKRRVTFKASTLYCFRTLTLNLLESWWYIILNPLHGARAHTRTRIIYFLLSLVCICHGCMLEICHTTCMGIRQSQVPCTH